MVFCLFGDVEEALTVARQQCRGTVLLIRRDYAYHRVQHRAGCRWASRQRTRRIPCAIWAFPIGWSGFRWSSVSPSGHWRTPGRVFSGSMTGSGAGEPPLHRLVPGPGPEFPYYLPNRKELCLLAVEIPAMEEA